MAVGVAFDYSRRDDALDLNAELEPPHRQLSFTLIFSHSHSSATWLNDPVLGD